MRYSNKLFTYCNLAYKINYFAGFEISEHFITFLVFSVRVIAMFSNSTIMTTRSTRYNVSSNISGENLWEICQTIVSFCTVVDFYLFLCLFRFHHKRHYAIVLKNDQEKTNASETPKTAFYAQRPGYRDDSYRRRTGPNKRFKTWMLRVAVAASFFALVKYLVDQAKFFYAWNERSDEVCEIANDLTEVTLYGITINCVYGFLWMRQWLFYNNPAVKGLLYRRCLIGFSKGLLIVILVLSSALAVFHLLPQRYKADDMSEIYVGCISIYDMNNIDDAWPIFLYIVLTSTFQISLLGLFIYPFIKRKIDSFARRKQGKGIDPLHAMSSPSVSQRSSPYSTRRNTYEKYSNLNSPYSTRRNTYERNLNSPLSIRRSTLERNANLNSPHSSRRNTYDKTVNVNTPTPSRKGTHAIDALPPRNLQMPVGSLMFAIFCVVSQENNKFHNIL